MLKNNKKIIGLLVLLIVAEVSLMAKVDYLFAEENKNFAFGIEYVFVGNGYKVAKYYSDIGATCSKFNGQNAHWEDIEPNPPKNGVHSYNWSKIDEAVRAMQGAGFVNLTIVIGSKSKWGSEPIPSEKGLLAKRKAVYANTAPKDEYWDDYAAWVTAFVERYDYDGVDDMPGLKAPVLHYEIMTEAQHEIYWRGSVEEYIKVLKTSYAAAKKANLNVEIILSGFMFFDLFDEEPLTDAQIEEKLKKVPSNYPSRDVRGKTTAKLKEHMEFNKRILQGKDYFDIVEFHLLNNYTGIEGAVNWIRNQMQKNGYQKSIWVGDAGVAPQIPSHNHKGPLAAFDTFNQFSAPLYDDGDKIYEVLTSKKDKHGYKYSQVRQWFLKEQSNFLTKSIVIEMNLGVVGTHIYSWLDGKPTKLMSGSAKNWQISGLREGNFFPTPTVGKPRPVFYTYKMIIEKLGSFNSVEKLSLGDSKINAYKFLINQKPIYVLWYDDRINQKPGEQEVNKTIDLSLILGSQDIKVTWIITQEDQTQPKVETVPSKNILLTETPIFIERD